jgi:predicted RNase H-like HicB family nuclease
MKSTLDQLSYTAIIQRDNEGYYPVTFPSLPGCVTFGRSYEEAIKMAQEVLELWIEELVESGKGLPIEQLSSVTVFHTSRPKFHKRSRKTYASAKRQRA